MVKAGGLEYLCLSVCVDPSICGECGEEKSLSEFKAGRAVRIHPCARMVENIWRACKQQGEDTIKWYNEQRASPAKRKKLKRWYRVTCGNLDGSKGKVKTFSPLTYQTQIKAELQDIRDGVVEMMHSAAWEHWAAKPKNWPPRGLSQTEAAAEFQRRLADPDKIVDFLGEHRGFESRIGVRTKTVLTRREMLSQSQGYSMSDRTIKKTGQKDVDDAYRKMQSNMDQVSGSTAALSSKEALAFLSKGEASGGLGSAASAFDGQLANLGGIQALAGLMDKHDDAQSEKEDSDLDLEADEPETNGKRKRKVKESKPKLWVEKDLKISAAIRTQETWKQEVITNLSELHKSGLHLVLGQGRARHSD